MRLTSFLSQYPFARQAGRRWASGIALLAILGLATAGSASAAELKWVENWDEAIALAKKEKKDLLVDFTGSDWCGWCIRLKNEVFTQESFEAEAPKHYVLVELDFPRTRPQTKELREQNEGLAKRFGVQGFPTLFVLDSAGRPYGQLGYQPGGPTAFLETLSKLRKEREERDKHFDAAKKAEGIERAKHLDKALSKIDLPLVFEFYGETLTEIEKLDSEDKLGLKEKYGFVPRELHEIQKSLMSGTDPKEVLTRVDKVLEKTGTKGESAQRAYFLRAIIFEQLAQKGAADESKIIENVKLAQAADPSSDLGMRLAGLLRQRGEEVPSAEPTEGEGEKNAGEKSDEPKPEKPEKADDE
ncbi:MAG TPA: thioredoxin family protein [Planctomycetota bacterium]|nr:thioredoxin family protein [Planctomycetota bacterium]